MSEEKPDSPKNDLPEVIRVRVARRIIRLEVELEDGSVKNYQLREMNGTLRDMWLNKLSKKTVIDKKSGGKVTDFTGLNASLICACAFTETGTPVHESEVQGWSSSSQEEVFKFCQKLNGLDKESAEAEKKD